MSHLQLILVAIIVILGGVLGGVVYYKKNQAPVAETIRYFIHRPRPFLSHEVHQLLSEVSYSFPSGHATFFFALSTGIFFYHRKLGILFYVSTVCMVIGRVISGIHYPSDIVAGAIIGIICGWFTCRYLIS